MKLDGSFVREFKLPEAYLPDENKTRGTRNNLAFESLAITADGKTLLAGTENALAQDGEIAGLIKAASRASSPSISQRAKQPPSMSMKLIRFSQRQRCHLSGTTMD